MDTSLLLKLFFIFSAGGATISMLLPERKNHLTLTCIASISSVLLLILSGGILLSGRTFHTELWRVSSLGVLSLHIDRLSALFIFITAIVYLPVSIYSAGYLEKYLGRYSLRSFSFFYHLLFASIILILIAADALSFLLSWEVMSILCYLLVNYEHEKQDNTRSGLLMLAMSEAGTLAVAIGLLILAGTAAGLDFGSLRASASGISSISYWAVFVLTFLGFGVKAGLVPVNTWLPRAYTAAPGNFSAILSGATLNLGIYGIMRINAEILQNHGPGTGIVILIAGSISALFGILYASTENDLKKMLAHSSIENAGIIITGFGAALVFMATGHYALSGIALITSLYHMVNHSIFKTLLFLDVSAIELKTGSRNMDSLGGLIKFMPWTGVFFLIGALSIAALPPFNGFVSEWLTLQTLLQSASLQSVPVRIVFALSGAALALTAGLAVTCFVKAFSMSFLGVSRSEDARRAVKLPFRMRLPMGFLAALCLIFGILPTYIIPVLDSTVTQIVHESVVDEIVPPFFTLEKGNARFSREFISEFHDLGAQTGKRILPGRGLVVMHRGTERNPVIYAMSTSYAIVVLILLLGGTYILAGVLTRRRRVTVRTEWNGGLRRLLPEMTYTATGFSNPVRVIFNAIFHPTIARETKAAVADHFRSAITRERRESHIVDRLLLQPVLRIFRGVADLTGSMHIGNVNVYAVYILISLLLLLIAGSIF